MWKIDLPLTIPVSQKKNLALNLNIYRNTHFQVLNKAKVNFADLIKPYLRDIPSLALISLCYVIYVPTKRRLDISNVCCIVDKFFCDALVDSKVIEDDSYDYLKKVEYVFGGMDRENPRIEVFIKPEEPDMRIILTQEDFQQIVEEYVSKRVIIGEDESIIVVMNDDGSAEVIIGEAPVANPAPRKRGRKSNAEKEAEAKKEEAPEPEEEEEEVAQEAAAEEEATDAATDEVVVKKSLFGGLSRPKN